MTTPGGRRKTWLLAVGVASVAVVCAVVLAMVLAFTVGKGRSAGGQARGATAKPQAQPAPRLGGPFLDPIQSRPQQLWSVALGTSRAVSFVGANQDVAVASTVSYTGPGSSVYEFTAFDAATGAKKWQVRTPIQSFATACALSGDSQLMCWDDNTSDAASRDGVPPNTTRAVFVSLQDGQSKNALISAPGRSEVFPLKDGFVIFKNPYATTGATSTVGVFSSSGEQRWIAHSTGGYPRVTLAEHVGLLSVRDSDEGTTQVFRIADGHQVGGFSELMGASTSRRPDLRVQSTSAGFTAENGKLLDVFNAQGQKINQISGWRTVLSALGATSAACGKIMLENSDGAIAAADSASGQILWQSPPKGRASVRGASCVGEYLLVQFDNAKELEVHESASGKKVASIPFEKDPRVIGTDGSVVLMRTDLGASRDSYNAYNLSNGMRLWGNPAGDEGQYLFSTIGGKASEHSDLTGGSIYLMSGKTLSRLGQKP